MKLELPQSQFQLLTDWNEIGVPRSHKNQRFENGCQLRSEKRGIAAALGKLVTARARRAGLTI